MNVHFFRLVRETGHRHRKFALIIIQTDRNPSTTSCTEYYAPCTVDFSAVRIPNALRRARSPLLHELMCLRALEEVIDSANVASRFTW